MAGFVHSKALILGASEVARLRRDIKRPVSTRPEYIRPGFGISEAEIRVYGVGGRTVDKTLHHDLWKVRHFKPAVVILHLGGNDLAVHGLEGQPEVVGRRLLQLCKILLTVYKVAKVVISELNPRYPPYCGREYPSDYNERVAAVNAFLQDKVKSMPGVFFWQHKVSILYWPELVDPEDGVHFNPIGSKRWYKSLKGALLAALRNRLL